MREVKSWVSDESCDAEAWELRDRVLAEGDRMLFGRIWGDGNVAAVRVFAEPKTRPSPSVLRDMVNSVMGAWEGKTAGGGSVPDILRFQGARRRVKDGLKQAPAPS